MKNGKILLFVGLGCGGVAALGLLVLCTGFVMKGVRSASSANNEISAAIDDLLRTAEDGNFAATYQSATTPAFRQATTAADYAKLGEVIHTQLGALRSKQIVRFNVRQFNASTSADVAYQATFERGTGTIHAVLKRASGRWLFEAFRVNSPTLLKDLPDQTCPSCGGKYASSARFCPNCGKAIPTSKK